MPYWRLSNFYFFYFAALGILVPFWSIYLQHLAFTSVEIGQLMAIPMVTKFVGPFLWGWLGDQLGKRMHIVRSGSLFTVIIFTAIFWTHGYWPLALTIALFSLFWNAVLPQFEAVTFSYLTDKPSHYALIRVWGSIGFILAVLWLGFLVEQQGAWVIPVTLMAAYIAIWLASLWVKDPVQLPHSEEQESILTILKQPHIIAFFSACFFLQAGHGVYYSFFSIHLLEVGYGESFIGQLWALGGISEVIIFLIMHRLLNRFSAKNILMMSLLLAVLRWWIIGEFSDSLILLLFAQLLHAATFGTFHAAAIHLVHHYFTGKHQGRGQALYGSLSFGLGGAVGSLVAGYSWDGLGASVTFAMASFISLLAFLIIWRWLSCSGVKYL